MYLLLGDSRLWATFSFWPSVSMLTSWLLFSFSIHTSRWHSFLIHWVDTRNAIYHSAGLLILTTFWHPMNIFTMVMTMSGCVFITHLNGMLLHFLFQGFILGLAGINTLYPNEQKLIIVYICKLDQPWPTVIFIADHLQHFQTQHIGHLFGQAPSLFTMFVPPDDFSRHSIGQSICFPT